MKISLRRTVSGALFSATLMLAGAALAGPPVMSGPRSTLNVVPDDFIGPLAPNQCRATDAGCAAEVMQNSAGPVALNMLNDPGFAGSATPNAQTTSVTGDGIEEITVTAKRIPVPAPDPMQFSSSGRSSAATDSDPAADPSADAFAQGMQAGKFASQVAADDGSLTPGEKAAERERLANPDSIPVTYTRHQAMLAPDGGEGDERAITQLRRAATQTGSVAAGRAAAADNVVQEVTDKVNRGQCVGACGSSNPPAPGR